MQNNYTTNNYRMSGPVFQSQLIRYDNPKIAFVQGFLVELYGMNIVTVMNMNTDDIGKMFSIYRILLENKELEHYKTLSPHTGQSTFYFMPENRRLSAKDFKIYIGRVEDYDDPSLCDALDDLTKFGFQIEPKPEQVVCKVSNYSDCVNVISDFFNIWIDKEKDYITPTSLYDLLWLYTYLKVPFHFIPYDEKDEEEQSMCEELSRLLAAFEKDNLYTNGSDNYVDFDGTFVYSKDLGKIKMTREEYFNRFPDADTMVTKK